jgi:hypothetical protein
MVRPARLELATLCLEGRRSIQLSYGRIGEHHHFKPVLKYLNSLTWFLTLCVTSGVLQFRSMPVLRETSRERNVPHATARAAGCLCQRRPEGAGYTRIQWLRTRAFTRVSSTSRTREFEACTGMWQSMQFVVV